MTTVLNALSEQNVGNNTRQVEAALKKHEAIATDIEARVGTNETDDCYFAPGSGAKQSLMVLKRHHRYCILTLKTANVDAKMIS